MSCYEYPEGDVNEDGADEPHCESHRHIGYGIAHEMSNSLIRVHDDNDRYVDSFDDMAVARAVLVERVS